MTAHQLATRPSRRPRPMNRWRLEWLRLTRSARGISLLAVYLVYGLLGPVLARYMADIVKHMDSGSGIAVTVTRAPVPKDGMANFISQVSQLGLIVTVVVAAGALSFDSRPGMSTFFRTRARHTWELVAPRSVVPALAAIGAYGAGTLAAWYETSLLIGPLPDGTVLQGFVLEVAFLAFTVSVVAGAASLVRGTLGTVGIAAATLLVLPVVGLAPGTGRYLPTTLMSAPIHLLNGMSITHFVPTLLVTIVLTALLLTVAVMRLTRRDC